MLSLQDNICKHDFERFISICFETFDFFSLTENGWEITDKEAEARRIKKILEPFHIRSISTSSWFAYSVPQNRRIEVCLYKTTQQAKDIFLKEYHSMFYEGSVWKKPEDICFFKGEKLIVGSSTHEKICYVYENDIEFLQKIIDCGNWKSMPDNKQEQICFCN